MGNDKTKEATIGKIKEYLDMLDIKAVSKGTIREDDPFDYASDLSYLKTSKKSHSDRDKEGFELSL